MARAYYPVGSDFKPWTPDLVGALGAAINNSGLYQIVANFTFAATEAGPIETQMYRNGNALPAAHAIDTGAAASNLVSQAFSALVTVPCNAPQATINVKALSATSVRIANIIVVKIA